MNQPNDFNYLTATDAAFNGPLDGVQSSSTFFSSISGDLGNFLGWVAVGLVFLFAVFALYYVYRRYFRA